MNRKVKRMIKQGLIIIVVIVSCFILQTTIFQTLALAEVAPNLLLIVTVSYGYMKGHIKGMTIGLICGLLLDCLYGSVIGLNGFIYMLIGYLNGYGNTIYYRDDFIIPIFLIGLSDFVCNFLYYIFEFLLRGRLQLFYYMRRIMLPELVYTILISVLLYKLLHSINERLEKKEAKEV